MPTATALRPSARQPSPSHRPIRVAYVIDNLSRAGTETQLLALIRSLDRTRFEPSLVLLDGTGAASRELEPDDCEVTRLGVRKLLGVGACKAASRLRRLWRDRRPDVVQAYFLDASYFGVPIARWVGVPTVLRVRNNLGYWLDAKKRLLNRLIRPSVHLSLTNSETGREALMRQDRLPADRVAVIENGVDLERFANLRPPRLSNAARIGCVANLRPVKNINGLLRAARIVLDQFPDVTIEIAGEGEQRAELELLTAELNLTRRVRFHGRVEHIPAFLGALDVAVLPSHSESMSNALLEYMAAGRVIVATDVGANAKLVRNDREGFIVPPGKDVALADRIVQALSDPTGAEGMARAARRRVEAAYSRQAMKEKFEDLYLRLAGRFGHGACFNVRSIH